MFMSVSTPPSSSKPTRHQQESHGATSRSFAARRVRVLGSISFMIVAALLAPGTNAEEEFSSWNLEPSIRQAHLVMIARVSRVSEVTFVEGAKTDIALREFRFQPVRILKGIFQRDELSMTANDLGCPPADSEGAPPLEEGEFRLLILTQPQGFGSLGCVSATTGASTLDERVPRLSGLDDPLVAVVETLIRVVDSRSRNERARMLVERLAETNGLAAMPLLTSLESRVDLIATDGRALPSLTRLLADSSPIIRNGALRDLRSLLKSSEIDAEASELGSVADALKAVLDSESSQTGERVAAIESLGSVLELGADVPWAVARLRDLATSGSTYAERTAALISLAKTDDARARQVVMDRLRELPLDELTSQEQLIIGLALSADAVEAEGLVFDRLQRSIIARQPVSIEVAYLGQRHHAEGFGVMLEISDATWLSRDDRLQIAKGLGRYRDDRAVPILAAWLRGRDTLLKEVALSALEEIDSPAAAQQARLALRTEGELLLKLRLCRFLGRHGIRDGFPIALEHLSDGGYSIPAALALAALDDPRTEESLSQILEAQPSNRWRAAALTGLVAVNDAAAKEELLTILADDRHPLIVEATLAVGLSDDPSLLEPLAPLIKSRNRQIALTAILSVRRYLCDVRNSPHGLGAIESPSRELLAARVASLDETVHHEVSRALDSLVMDSYVDADLRLQALAVAGMMKGSGYAIVVHALTDQADLEDSQLLLQATTARRKLR